MEGKGYIGTGESSGVRYRDFYAFDPVNDMWEQRASLGTNNRRQAYAFTINDQGYVGGGVDFVENWNDFHRYDVITNSWVQVTSFPLTVCKNGTSFSTGEEAFIVGGNGQAPVLSHAWRFSPDISTTVNEEDRSDLRMYPNPAHAQLFVHGADRAPYTIHDARGALVQTGILNGAVDVHALPEGLYVLQLEGIDKRISLRFVVQRY
jgi:hypothetical protein